MVNRLQLTRQASGIAQGELARTVGISQEYLCRLESGRHRPSSDLARRLAEALGVDPAWLFRREEIRSA